MPYFPRRSHKTWAVLLAVVLIPCAIFLAAGWYYSGVIKERAFRVEHEPEQFDLRVTSHGTNMVSLLATSDTPTDGEWNRHGRWGLKSSESYNQVSSIISMTNLSVAREMTVLTHPTELSAFARMDPYAYPEDPLIAHEIEFREVNVPMALGHFPAWLTGGGSGTWAILVHGQGSSRQQLLRILPVLAESGHPTLTITYRHDRNLPKSPSEYYQFGAEEWEDLEAAISFALDAGAEDVILVGYSMSRAIAVSLLYNSALAVSVRGVILDSPALHFDKTVDFNGAQEQVLGMPLPGALTSFAKTLTAIRLGVDFSTMNHLERFGELPPNTPLLLLHGNDDTSVPISISEEFAMARPDIVELHVFHEAIHVRLWNHDAERYESVVRDFRGRLD